MDNYRGLTLGEVLTLLAWVWRKEKYECINGYVSETPVFAWLMGDEEIRDHDYYKLIEQIVESWINDPKSHDYRNLYGKALGGL